MRRSSSLLYGDKENRLVWEGEKGLAPLLHQEGFAVITVDLRKHGQSTNVARSPGDSPAGGKNTEGTNMQSADYGNMVDSRSPRSQEIHLRPAPVKEAQHEQDGDRRGR